MNNHDPSRRQFLQRSGTALGGAWLGLNLGAVMAVAGDARAAMAANVGWRNISAAEARVLMAVADQIYPPGDTPGAAEIGAVHFMDAAFGGFMAGALPGFRKGISDLDRRSGEAGFAGLEFDDQTRVLAEVEDTAFFGQAHFLTLCGLFALPALGGNIDGQGWQQLGFEARHAWQPPFGHYDAEAAREAGDG